MLLGLYNDVYKSEGPARACHNYFLVSSKYRCGLISEPSVRSMCVFGGEYLAFCGIPCLKCTRSLDHANPH